MATAARWPQDSVLIYVPPQKSQAKGIETRALSGGSVVTLGEHPAVSADVQGLGRQYERLWRVILLVHPDFQHDDLGLSRAIDVFLREVWGVTPDQCESHIREIARFDYIPEAQREGAVLFKALCEPEPPLWTIYLSAARTVHAEMTMTPREQACRGYLMTLDDNPDQCGETLRARFVNTGSIERRIAEVTEQVEQDIDGLRTILRAVHSELSGARVAPRVRLQELSEKHFEEQARAIFRLYSPAEERGRLTSYQRNFITRNRRRSGRERYRLVEGLRKYDLSDLPRFAPQFNREDPFSEAKLKAIEDEVLGPNREDDEA